MTKQELIQEVKDELTGSCALPYSIPPREFERIIRLAKSWFRINYQYAVETQYYVLPLASTFNNSEFKNTRSIKLPDCVVSVFEVKEIKGWSKVTMFGADFSAEKMIAQELYLSPFQAEDLVLRTAYESYMDLSKAFFIERISYDFNHNSQKLKILGRDPKHDVFLQTYVDIAEEKLFDDYQFRRWVAADAKVSLGKILGMFSYQLPGGVAINADNLVSEGKEEKELIKQEIQDENSPDFMFVFH